MTLQLYYDQFQYEGNQAEPLNLVLLHGWGMHSAVWDRVMPELVKHYRVTQIELPGFGRSPMPGGEYNLDYLVEHVLAVAPEKAVWLGWSLGGSVALKVASQFPERVMALVGCAATPCFVQAESWPHAMAQKIFDGFYTFLLEDWEGTLIRFLSLQCKGSETMKEDIRFLKEILYHHGLPATKALRCGLEVLAGADLRQELKNLPCSSAWMFGEKDNLVPLAVAADIKDLNSNVEWAEIKGASHVPFISHPELFIQALMDFTATLMVEHG